jgi:peptide/nickel transport system substrate-binding protein
VHLDRIVFKPASDAAAAAAALKAGDLQALDSVATTELAGVQHTSSLHTLKANGLGYEAVFVNMGNKNGVNNLPYGGIDTPLASSAKLRQAFEEAINRNTLSRVVFDDHVLAGCTPLSPASTWFDARVKCTPYNPADAKKLVAASGVSSPTVHLLTQSLTEQLLLAQFIQAQEAAVGINVVIDAADSPTALARATKGTYDAFLNSWSGGNDPDRNIFTFLATSGSRNFSGYSNPRLDLILANGRKAITDQARKTLYHAAIQIILNARPLIYLYHPIRYAGVSAKVTGVQLWRDTQLRVDSAKIK